MERKKLGHLFLVLVFLLSHFMVDMVAGLPKPEASVTDVSIKKVTITDGITYLAKVEVKNPYFIPILIGDVEYTLKSIDRVIASGSIPDPGSLKAKDNTMLDVDVKVPHSILLTLIKDIVGDWDINYELEIKLIMDLSVFGNFTLPITQKGEMKLPTFREMIGLGSDSSGSSIMANHMLNQCLYAIILLFLCMLS